VSNGGGGSSSPKAGGLKDGLRRMWMGRTGPELGSWMCAACGRVRRAAAVAAAEAEARWAWVGGLLLLLLVVARFEVEALLLGRGEFLRRRAPGQPHSGRSGSRRVESGRE